MSAKTYIKFKGTAHFSKLTRLSNQFENETKNFKELISANNSSKHSHVLEMVCAILKDLTPEPVL